MNGSTKFPPSKYITEHTKEQKEEIHKMGDTVTEISPSAQTWLGTFDPEEDHLLDYFLSGEQGESSQGQGQAVQTKPSHDIHPSVRDGSAMTHTHANSRSTPSSITTTTARKASAHAHQIGVHTVESERPLQLQQQSNNAISISQSNRCREDARKQTPSTPAVEFYASTSKKHHDQGQARDAFPGKVRSQEQLQQQQQQQQAIQPLQQPAATTLPSTNLEGIASSTPILHVHQQFQSQGAVQGPFQVTGISPISPALMCTNEVLMLPGGQHPASAHTHSMPARNATLPTQSLPTPSSAQAVPVQQQQWTGNTQTQTNKNQHTNPQMALPAWLQHMNNVASMAGQLASQTQQATNQTSVIPNPTASFNAAGQHQHQPIFPQQQIQIQNTRAPGHQIFPGSAAGNDIMPFPMSHLQHLSGYKEPNATETKEKRERRLARNRESARQSRRRKKELLLNLQAQVNKLHNDIENERRRKISSMESALTADKEQIMNDIFRDQSFNGHTALNTEKLVFAVRNGGPNTTERKTAIGFQYNSLQNLLLPRNRRMLLSLSLQDEMFFTSAKEARIKVQKTSGRISSKQVGDEISKNHADSLKQTNATKQSLSCSAFDKELFWPLLCYELSIGIDQEEKLLSKLQTLHQDPNMPHIRDKIFNATTMVSKLRDGLLSHCCSTSNLNELQLLQILTPAQSIRFLQWYMANKDRCKKLIGTRVQCDAGANAEGQGDDSLPKNASTDSLIEVCQRLTEAMKIKRQDTRD